MEYNKVNYKGFDIEIFYDESPENPRTDWDHDSEFYMNPNPRRINPENKDLDDLMERYNCCSVKELCEKIDKDYIWVKVYIYEHSGVSLSTTPFNDPWDSSLYGILVVEKDKVRKFHNKKRISKKIREEEEGYLVAQVEIFGAYLNGDVYGFQITDKDGKLIDSCSGYYGKIGLEDMKAEYEGVIDARIEAEENAEKE